MSASTPDHYVDRSTPGEILEYDVVEVLYTGQSDYQKIEILDLAMHGRTLFLDGNLQSAEHDEHLYHEALIHPAMLLLEDLAPRQVLILGGGEGATLREVLRYPTVERAVMVDLDRQVVDVCREHLPGHHAGAFDDPRVELLYQDASRYLQECSDRYDVIVFDIVDPADAGPATHLFESASFRLIQSRLAPGGLLTMQYGPVFGTYTDGASEVMGALRDVFQSVRAGRVFVPSFHGTWGMLLAGDRSIEWTDELLDSRIAERLTTPPRSLDGAMISGQFTLPLDDRRALGF